MAANQLALARSVSRSLTTKFGVITTQDPASVQKRYVHESFIPSGPGGRSSTSGVSATVFGGTGFIGHVFLNRLCRHGASVVVPHRGSYQHVNRIKLMADLGQLLLRPFSINDDDDRVRDLIRYSNCVVNFIGSKIPYNHYSQKEVNVDWPLRLASLVAEKNDGTRLVHMTYLNSNSPKARKASNLLQMNHDAEVGMREIYPETIIVRSSNVFGLNDTYTNFFMHTRFEEDLAKLGAMPLLYDGGRSTITQPIYVGDVGEAITRILKHLDSPGQTFELCGPRRYLLRDFVQYLYKVFDKDCYIYNTLGPMDKGRANIAQKLVQTLLLTYFKRQTMPRIVFPRFLDMMTRKYTSYEQWATKDFFDQLHLNDERTGAPGLEQLGIEPTIFEDKAHVIWGIHKDFHTYTIPSLENYPDIKEQPNHLPRISAV